MGVEFTSIPIAAVAGALGVLSPCVWPLVPVIMSAAMGEGGRRGALLVSIGLALSFALAGTGISFALVQLNLDPELFRYVAGAGLIVVAAVLLMERLASIMSVLGTRVTGRLHGVSGDASSPWGALGVGGLLGLVWLPCVGPTLGAAIALASVGQDFLLAFATMAAYGAGTGAVLLAAGLASQQLLQRWRPKLAASTTFAKQGLGAVLGLLGFLVLTGLDKRLEAWSLNWLPDWSLML